MKKQMKFSEFKPTGESQKMNKLYETNIVSSDGSWDWQPLKLDAPITWKNLARRTRGEA